MKFEKARNIMVESQLRPNRISKPEILSIFMKIEKEMFLSNDLQEIAYSDVDIKVTAKRGYLKNLHIAQLIHHSHINKEDKILHIGALTGYVSSILSMLIHILV